MAEIILALGFVLLATILGSLGALFSKIGSTNFDFDVKKQFKNKHLIIGGVLYLASMIPMVLALRFAELSFIYPFISLSYIWTLLLSIKFLKEEVNYWAWVGIAFIIIGVSFIGFAV